ncbi:EamA family transporter RarD [Microbacterium excoecariae]|uniref:EamA family transporter RarD n=1 Tax=Microbacterium excoecariae TaxID=2715210 RepID=UPI0014089C7F|nr:EamA family transporter RarD [Microbacterium excoecariae]
MTTRSAPAPAVPSGSAAGVAYGFGAYLLWGVLPLYFVLLAPTGAWEILSWRVLFSLVLCAALLTVTRGWGRLVAVVRSRRLALWGGAAGLLIYINWQVFLIAATTDRVLEASLGYFINPLATVLLAVLVLGERLRRLQWAALGVAGLAVLVICVFYGSVPWISLVLSASFALYGLVKKQYLGAHVDAVSGLTLETAWLAPIAGVQLVIVGATTGITLGQHGAGHTALLLLAGAVTAVPLLLFASAARRVSLTTIGLLQFAAPILQFLVGAWILGEHMPPERWAGFALIWVACALLAADLVLHGRRARAARAANRYMP